MISKPLVIQVAVFGVVGVAATLVHYLIAILSLDFLFFSPYWANLVGYITAVAVSFFGHSRFTFQKKMTKRKLSKFVPVSIATFFLSQCVLYLMTSIFQQPEKVALAVAVVTIPFVSFVLNKFWVFSD